MRRLPPLNALRAFESAARHLSFTKAAEELHVTPGAISHQIRALEDRIGQPLFQRLTRALLLTEAGQRALPLLRDGFDSLADAVEVMSADRASGILTVSASPSFAALWLVPRLDRFAARHPDIDIRIDATIGLTDFRRDNVDVAIRYGPGGYDDLHSDHLFPESLFPVCAPSLPTADRPLAEPADLAHHTLLHIDWGAQAGTWPDWRMWLAAAGVDGVDTTRGPRFSLAETALLAAAEGKGVALGPDVLVEGYLRDGRLICPFDLQLDAVDFAYYIVCPKGWEARPRIAAFRGWLRDEARDYVPFA